MTPAPSHDKGEICNFATYARELEAQLASLTDTKDPFAHPKALADAMDGQGYRKLRGLVSQSNLRKDGVFFTSPRLAHRTLKNLLRTVDDKSIVADPACGIGDLLIPCALRILKSSSDSATPAAKIVGVDIHREFLEVLRLRLTIIAVASGRTPSEVDRLLHSVNLNERDFLTDPDLIEAATHIVLNPPYTMLMAPDGTKWGTGAVSSAAVFMERCLSAGRKGTRISAILPDVLRSGSRYEKWRNAIARLATIERIEVVGRFDKTADVDVFIMDCIVSNNDGRSWHRFNQPAPTESTLGDFFEIRVGPLVSYRDPQVGEKYPFIQAHTLPMGGVVSSIRDFRRFSGTVFRGPLITVRRTSRPGDACRAVATVIEFRGEVAIENHLLCLLPRKGGMRQCRDGVRVLRDPRTTVWLNNRIRCRHLTVKALSEIPWWPGAR